jgi:hypothetical protein
VRLSFCPSTKVAFVSFFGERRNIDKFWNNSVGSYGKVALGYDTRMGRRKVAIKQMCNIFDNFEDAKRAYRSELLACMYLSLTETCNVNNVMVCCLISITGKFTSFTT